MPHDERIAGLSGQPFGADYFDGLLRDGGAVFDSEPPTTAILAAENLAGRGLDLLKRIQRAHYVEGRRIADPAVLRDLAAEIGLDADAYAAAQADAPAPPRLITSRKAAACCRRSAARASRPSPWSARAAMPAGAGPLPGPAGAVAGRAARADQGRGLSRLTGCAGHFGFYEWAGRRAAVRWRPCLDFRGQEMPP